MAGTSPSLSGTKEIYHESIFRSVVVRWIWIFYSQRLTSAGRWFLWPTLIFTSYGSLSLTMQAYVLFAYGFGLWAVALLGLWLWQPKVLFQARHVERICAGETLPVEIEVQPRGGIGRTVLNVLPHRLPREIDVVSEGGVTLPPLARGEKARAELALFCPRRGVYRLPAFRVETSAPVGLMRAYQVVPHDRPLIVYPSFTRLARLHIPTGRRLQPGGVALASTVGDSFEYVGNREYRDGDNVRDIDWRATARLSRPIVREYREEYFLRVAVILDTHVPPKAKAEARDSFERAVSTCAAVSDYMARQDYLVDIFAAGPNLYHLTAGRSLAYLDQILDILACVEANPEEPFAVIEPELTEHLARITSVVCIFMDWDDARRTFAHRLREQGSGLKVIIVRDTPCTLDPSDDAGLLGAIPVIGKAAYDGGVEEL